MSLYIPVEVEITPPDLLTLEPTSLSGRITFLRYCQGRCSDFQRVEPPQLPHSGVLFLSVSFPIRTHIISQECADTGWVRGPGQVT